MLTGIEWWLFYERSSCMHRATCLSETNGGDPGRKSLSGVRINLKELAPKATLA